MVSTFDSDVEGWSTTDSTVDLTWVSGGYYIEELDTSPYGVVWYFVSPDGWDGNWSSYIGGTLQYDMRFWKVSSTGSKYEDPFDIVRIYSGAGNYVAWISNYDPSSTGPYWDTLQFQLSEASSSSITGTKSFNEIMSDVTALYIRGDWWTMVDRTGLDNVSVVPIPSAILLFGSSLIGLVGLRRKFRK